MCPFAGLIIYTGFYHIGTFCQDGTFTLPIGHPLYQQELPFTLVHYSLPGLGEIHFASRAYNIYLTAGSYSITDPCNMHAQSMQANTPYSPLVTGIDGDLHIKSETFHSATFDDQDGMSSLIWMHKYNDVADCNISISARAMYQLALYSVNNYTFTTTNTVNNGKNIKSSTEFGISKPYQCSIEYQCGSYTPYLKQRCSMSSRTVVLRLRKGACWPQLYAELTVYYFRICDEKVTLDNFVPIQLNVENKIYQAVGLCGFTQLDLNNHVIVKWKRDYFTPLLCTYYTTMKFVISSSQSVSLNVTFIKKFNISETIYTESIARAELDFDLCTTLSVMIHIVKSNRFVDGKAIVRISNTFDEMDAHDFYADIFNSIPCHRNISNIILGVRPIDAIAYCEDRAKSPTDYRFNVREKDFVIGFFDSNKGLYQQLSLVVHPSYLFLWAHNTSLSASNVKCTSLGEGWRVMSISHFKHIIAMYAWMVNQDTTEFKMFMYVTLRGIVPMFIHFEVTNNSPFYDNVYQYNFCTIMTRFQKYHFKSNCFNGDYCNAIKSSQIPPDVIDYNKALFCNNDHEAHTSLKTGSKMCALLY